MSGKSVRAVARELDLTETALRSWVRHAEVDAGRGAPGALTTDERKELARLRRENRTLRMERDILRKITIAGVPIQPGFLIETDLQSLQQSNLPVFAIREDLDARGIKLEESIPGVTLTRRREFGKLGRALLGVPALSVVRVASTDPAAKHDYPAWCRDTGHGFLGQHSEPAPQ